MLLSFAIACDENMQNHPAMLAIEKAQGFETITEEHLKARELSRSTGAWRPLSIFFDLTELNKSLVAANLRERIPFYKDVFAAVGGWWSDAVKVNDNKSVIAQTIASNFRRGGEYANKYLNFQMGGANQSHYDLLLKVMWAQSEPDSTALAYAGPILRHPTSQRPITGQCVVTSYGNGNWRGNSALTQAAGTIIHEFGHVISFISWQRYQAKNIEINRELNSWVWKGANVLKYARAYYGCPNLTGVPLQTGTDGRPGGHWNEQYLGNEIMTPTTRGGGDLFSNMSLALAEDSGWYQPDYSMAENFQFRKNSGCNWGKCMSSCNTNGPTIDQQVYGFCSRNPNSGCSAVVGYSNRKCHEAESWNSSYTAAGASYGSSCSIITGRFRAVGGGMVST